MPNKESFNLSDWLHIVEKDLLQVEHLMDIHDSEGAGFFLQQAVNKFFKAFSQSRGWELERINSLETLLNRAYHPLHYDISKGLALNEIIYDDTGKAIDFKIIDVNHSYESITGLEREMAVGCTASNLYGTEEPAFSEIISQISAFKKSTSFEAYFSTLKKQLNISVFASDKGKFTTVFSDITERKRAEEKIEHLNQLLGAIRNFNQIITREKNKDKLIKGICDTLTKKNDYTYAWISLIDESGNVFKTVQAGLGKNFSPLSRNLEQGILPKCAQMALKQTDLITIDDPANECTDCPVTKKSKDTKSLKKAICSPLKYGGKIFALLTISCSDFASYEKGHILLNSISEDIAYALYNIEKGKDRKRVKETKKLSETNYRDIFDTANAAIFIYDIETESIIDSNKKMSEIYGYTAEEINNLKIWDIITNEFPDPQEEALRLIKNTVDKGPQIIELRTENKHGKEFWIELNLNCTVIDGKERLIAIIRDINRRKSLEEQLLQSQKMEAIGRLGGGIAHDFNNLLTVINGHCELMASNYRDHTALCTNIEEIKKAADHAALLTGQLLTFSRRQVSQTRVLNLNDVITNIESMAGRILGEDIEVVTHLEPELEQVSIGPGLIDQIIMNMAINARDAMPDGGKLIINTRNIDMDEESCKIVTDAKPGKFVCLSITDTGIGMDKKITQHIFEPFFSTKEPGKGTGLGLSVIYGIVKQYNGWINVYTEIGKGSTFKIYLPSSSEKSETIKDESEETILLENLHGNGETILLVEDEDIVRKFATRVLTEKGYIVFTAASVKEALDIFMREKEEVSIVFSDIVLPDRSGLQLIEELISLNPELCILLSSGYSNPKSELDDIQKRGFSFLQKPYTIIEMLQSIKSLKSHAHITSAS